MDPKEIAQLILDKAVSVTMASRRDELAEVFNSVGIVLSGDGTTVQDVKSEASFDDLVSALKSSMPTVSMTVKRAISAN